MATKYAPIKREKIPAKVRFDVPPQSQGQIVEVAYGGFETTAGHCDGAPYKRVTDTSVSGHPTTYYALVRAVTVVAVHAGLTEDAADDLSARTSVGRILAQVECDSDPEVGERVWTRKGSGSIYPSSVTGRGPARGDLNGQILGSRPEVAR